MAKKKWTPEDRELFAEWAEESRQFEALYERLKARWREEDERRERRRRLVRRLIPFVR